MIIRSGRPNLILGPCSGSVPLASVAQLGTMGSTWLPSTKTKMENMSHPFGNNVGIILHSFCQALTRKILACLLLNAVSPDSGWLRSWWVEPAIIRFIYAKKRTEKEMQIRYQLLSIRPKLEGNLENLQEIKQKSCCHHHYLEMTKISFLKFWFGFH